MTKVQQQNIDEKTLYTSFSTDYRGCSTCLLFLFCNVTLIVGDLAKSLYIFTKYKQQLRYP